MHEFGVDAGVRTSSRSIPTRSPRITSPETSKGGLHNSAPWLRASKWSRLGDKVLASVTQKRFVQLARSRASGYPHESEAALLVLQNQSVFVQDVCCCSKLLSHLFIVEPEPSL